MKIILTAGFAVLLLAGSAIAQDQLVLKKAQQIRDANNARQAALSADGSTAPAPVAAAPTPTPAAPAVQQTINPAQQQLIERLESDFAIIKSGVTATADQKQAMVNEMTSLAKGAVKPTKSELTKLAGDLAMALTTAEKQLPPRDTTLIAKDVNIVENSSFLGPAKAQTYVAEVRSTLKNNGALDTFANSVANDLKAIVDEIQKGKSKLDQ